MLYEMLIVVAERKHNKGLIQRGEVVAARPSSSNISWSERERTNPEWQLVTVDLTPSEVAGLLTPELDELKQKNRVWKRQRRINIDVIPELKKLREGSAENIMFTDTLSVRAGIEHKGNRSGH